MTVLLDTNVISEATRPRPDPSVARWLSSLSEDETFISVISIAELRAGLARLPPGKRRSALESWLEMQLLERYRPRLIEVSLAIAEAWGQIAADIRSKGRLMPIMDGFIAATARVHSLAVATRNIRDFAPLGVKTINPWEV